MSKIIRSYPNVGVLPDGVPNGTLASVAGVPFVKGEGGWAALAFGSGGEPGGDLLGPISAPTVVGLRGLPVASVSPAEGDALVYQADGWTPTALAQVATTGSYDHLTNKPTLGTAAAKNTGTSAGNVVEVQTGGKLPALDGSQLTNVGFAGARPLWARPASPDPKDEEFNGTLGGFTLGAGSVATPIDPYASFASGGWRYSLTYRPDWLMLQPDASGAPALVSKTVSLATNELVIARLAAFRRADTAASNDGKIFMSLGNAAGTDRIDLVHAYSAGADPRVRFFTKVGGVFQSSTAEIALGVHFHDVEFYALHKIGTTVHAWVAPSSGQWRYVGTLTGWAATLDTLLIAATDTSTSAPGNLILGCDLVRFIPGATQLP